MKCSFLFPGHATSCFFTAQAFTRDKGLLRGMVLSESSEALNSGCVACNREHFLVLAAFQPLTESFPSLAGKNNVYFKVYYTNC